MAGGAPQHPELDEQQRQAEHRHAASAAAEKPQRRAGQIDAHAEGSAQLHQTAGWRTNNENCTNISERLVRRMRSVWPRNQANGDLLSSRTSCFWPNCSFMMFSVCGCLPGDTQLSCPIRQGSMIQKMIRKTMDCVP